ncbi:hypothetical protein FOL47_000373 [Perkinsus chesapeaki]|uniref:Uncharacterized protein n=1 Tax=Perkinsus chesapeaki TaxID=330153 RepID=A0A7J6KY17_PERCH|nr:hypothetical protein FOL47_000373 [Perkinsus chesapeaki]
MDLPQHLGIPAKWCGYAALPRPRIRPEPTATGCVYALPDHLEPRPIIIGKVASIKKGKRQKVGLADQRDRACSEPPRPSFRDTLGSSFDPQVIMSQFLPTHKSLDTVTAVIAETAKHRTQLMTGPSVREQRLAALRATRRATKGIFGCNAPPWREGDLRAREKARDRLINPGKWRLIDHREEVDRKAVLKRRVDKGVHHYCSTKSIDVVNTFTIPRPTWLYNSATTAALDAYTSRSSASLTRHPQVANVEAAVQYHLVSQHQRGGYLRPVNSPPFPPSKAPVLLSSYQSVPSRTQGQADDRSGMVMAPPRMVVRPASYKGSTTIASRGSDAEPPIPRYAEHYKPKHADGELVTAPKGTPSTLSVLSKTSSPTPSAVTSLPSYTPVIEASKPVEEKRKSSGSSHISQLSQPSTVQCATQHRRGALASTMPSRSPPGGSRFEALFQDALNRQERQRTRKEEFERMEKGDLQDDQKDKHQQQNPLDIARFKQSVDSDVRARQERKARREAQRIKESCAKAEEDIGICPMYDSLSNHRNKAQVSGRRGSLSGCYSPSSTFGSSPIGRSPIASSQVSPRLMPKGRPSASRTVRRQSVSSLLSIEENMSPPRRMSYVGSPRPSVASQLSPRSPSLLGDSVIRECRELRRRLDVGPPPLRASSLPLEKGPLALWVMGELLVAVAR